MHSIVSVCVWERENFCTKLYFAIKKFRWMYVLAMVISSCVYSFSIRISFFHFVYFDSFVEGEKKSSYTTAKSARITVALYQWAAIEWHRNAAATTSRVTKKANTHPKWVETSLFIHKFMPTYKPETRSPHKVVNGGALSIEYRSHTNTQIPIQHIP